MGEERLWSESWELSFAGGDHRDDRGAPLAGFVRLALWPNQRRAWWWTSLLVGGRLVAVRDHDVVPPRSGLEIRAEGLWGELVCETPGEHWSIGLEAFAVAFDDPSDAWGDEWGERLPVGLDLGWEALPRPGPGDDADEAGGAPVPGRVDGEILVADARIPLSGQGLFEHRRGTCDWWEAPPPPRLAYLDGEVRALPGRALPQGAVEVGRAPVLLTGPDGKVARLARSLVREREGGRLAWAQWTEGLRRS